MLALLFVGPALTVAAQGFINQDAVAELLNRRAESLDDIPEVFYEYYILNSTSGNNVIARNNFYKIVGNGDITLGRERAELVQMINRRLMQNTSIGDTLIIPTNYDVDFRAFSPFPRYYTGGRAFDKLFIMDKTIQAFAAYEYGKLARWGIMNTGNPGRVANAQRAVQLQLARGVPRLVAEPARRRVGDVLGGQLPSGTGHARAPIRDADGWPDEPRLCAPRRCRCGVDLQLGRHLENHQQERWYRLLDRAYP